MATATAHHHATVNPSFGLGGSVFAADVDRADRVAARLEEFANRKLICAVAPDAPVGGFAG